MISCLRMYIYCFGNYSGRFRPYFPKIQPTRRDNLRPETLLLLAHISLYTQPIFGLLLFIEHPQDSRYLASLITTHYSEYHWTIKILVFLISSALAIFDYICVGKILIFNTCILSAGRDLLLQSIKSMR